jgi:hypothetical protein
MDHEGNSSGHTLAQVRPANPLVYLKGGGRNRPESVAGMERKTHHFTFPLRIVFELQ